MARYGFRLFEVRLREGRGHKDKPFHNCDGAPYIEIALEALGRLQGHRQHGDPTDPDAPAPDGDPIAPTYALKIDSVARRGQTIRLNFHVGVSRDHDIALGLAEEVDDIDLDRRAPGRPYRAILAFPSTGDVGILAVEDVSRHCPRDTIIRHLNAEVARMVVAGLLSTRWRIAGRQLTDEHQLDILLNRGQVDSIHLVQHSINSDNQRRTRGVTVTADSSKIEYQKDEIVAAAKGWVRAKMDGRSGETDRQAAKTLATFVGEGFGEIDFDDGWVVLDGDTVNNRKISPSRASDVFVYAIGSDRPNEQAFYREVTEVAPTLGRSLDIDIDWPPH